MDLIVDGAVSNQGERQVTPSVLRNGRIIFTTLVPSADLCAAGGDSWLMELDALTGARLLFSPFDLNQDGVFDTEDYGELPGEGDTAPTSVPTSGIKSPVGIISTPAILSAVGGGENPGGEGPVNPCAAGAECKVASGSSGALAFIRENPGQGEYGRQSWREL